MLDDEPSIARYFVSSRPHGLMGELETKSDGGEAVRDVLVKWLQKVRPELANRPGPHVATGCAHLWIRLTGSATGLVVSTFGYGPEPAPNDWPRVSLADLLDFAEDDLRGAR